MNTNIIHNTIKTIIENTISELRKNNIKYYSAISYSNEIVYIDSSMLNDYEYQVADFIADLNMLCSLNKCRNISKYDYIEKTNRIKKDYSEIIISNEIVSSAIDSVIMIIEKECKS